MRVGVTHSPHSKRHSSLRLMGVTDAYCNSSFFNSVGVLWGNYEAKRNPNKVLRGYKKVTPPLAKKGK